VFLRLLLAIRDLASMGKVHRDIKPSNIMAQWSGEGKITSWLGDFDTVVSVGEYVSSAGYTPNFSHPAIAEGSAQVSPLFDIYSAGAILYYLYSGSMLFEAAESGRLALDGYAFPQGKKALGDPALQAMVLKSIQPLSRQHQDGWGYSFMESQSDPLGPVQAFLAEYTAYLVRQGISPSALAPGEIALWAGGEAGPATVEYEVTDIRLGEPNAASTSFRRTAFLTEGSVVEVEYAYLSKDSRLRKFSNTLPSPARVGVKYRERVSLFSFFLIEGQLRYIVCDENYVAGNHERSGRLRSGLEFILEDEANNIRTVYKVLKVSQ